MIRRNILYNTSRFVIVALLLALIIRVPSIYASSTFWQIEAVDTMKMSRDVSRESDILSRISKYVDAAAKLQPTHITVATPYDEEFYPVLSKWVAEIHSKKIHVWFRGNWSSWEGWFGYPLFKNYQDHHAKTENFIKQHRELFEEGDIFTPAPEPENGGFGDPRLSYEKAVLYRQFLIDSYNACMRGKEAIGINFTCGYFSMNGDIVRDILTPDTVSRMGGVVVVDHFVSSPQKLAQDLKDFHEKYNAKVVLGEFGAPIPDIHGDLTQEEQKEYVGQDFTELTKLSSFLLGVNYWTVFGGSTHVVEDNLDERPVADIIRAYYQPIQISGIISDEFGNRIEGAIVTSDRASASSSAVGGKYTLKIPKILTRVSVSKTGYNLIETEVLSDEAFVIQNFTLHHAKVTSLERITLSIKGFLTKIVSLFYQF